MSDAAVLDALAGLALFSDLERPQLQAVAHTLAEEAIPAGQRVLRQGFSGSGFFIILEGEVAVHVDGHEVATLGKGDFFGEISLLLGEPPVADVLATTEVRALHLAGPDLKAFLLAYPAVMFRMLQAVSRRLDRANRRS
jgi:CRP-like cAMP-binding protein